MKTFAVKIYLLFISFTNIKLSDIFFISLPSFAPTLPQLPKAFGGGRCFGANIKRDTKRLAFFIFVNGIVSFSSFAQSGWQLVNSFGSNPGNLNMYSYAPANMPTNAALVVAMHGCTQNATQCATQTGWNHLADVHGFYVVYPEQKAVNNSSTCFNWFNAGDQERGQGEALSIKQMVDYMVSNFNIDTNQIFVTGLSAGAAMTSVMMATYPEVFSKGAILAGGPYKAATDVFGASAAMNGSVTKTAVQWGDLVRNENSWYSGPFPKAAIFHGNSDPVVNINNATELVKQWTNVNAADQTADATINNFSGNSLVTKSVYSDAQNKPVVEKYIISNFGHAVPLDTGSCYQQGGATATYAVEVNFYSTFWAAYFFGILDPPYSINGPDTVSTNQTNVVYSIANNSGSTYQWTVPAGATIISGQGTSTITVNFAANSGIVSVTETATSGCKNGPSDLFVTAITSTGIETTKNELLIQYNSEERNIHTSIAAGSIELFTIGGQVMNGIVKNNSQNFRIAGTLLPGVYMVRIVYEGKYYYQKLIVY